MGYTKLVGVEGFEPPTTCSQSKCATRLRYTPSGLSKARANYTLPRPEPRNAPAIAGNRYAAGAPPSPAGAAAGSSLRAGGSSSAFLDRRTRPLSSASSTFTFTIWPSLR